MYLLTNTSISTLFVSQGGVTIKLYPYESVTLDEAQAKSFKELNDNEALILESVDGSPLPKDWKNGVQDPKAAMDNVANIANTRIKSGLSLDSESDAFDRTSPGKMAIYNDREKIRILEADKKASEQREENKKKLEELQSSKDDNKTNVAKSTASEGSSASKAAEKSPPPPAEKK